MARSLKKGPFIHYKLQKKVDAMNESGKNSVIKTWSRASMISPDFCWENNCCSQWKTIYSSVCY